MCTFCPPPALAHPFLLYPFCSPGPLPGSPAEPLARKPRLVLGAWLLEGWSIRTGPGPLTPRGAKEAQAKGQAEQQHCGRCEVENWAWFYGSPCPWAKVAGLMQANCVGSAPSHALVGRKVSRPRSWTHAWTYQSPGVRLSPPPSKAWSLIGSLNHLTSQVLSTG